MTTIDTRFLQTRPATVAWWQQREKCLACRHVSATPDVQSASSSATVLRCLGVKPVRIGSKGVGRHQVPYCIDARAEGGECGPAGAKFEAKR